MFNADKFGYNLWYPTILWFGGKGPNKQKEVQKQRRLRCPSTLPTLFAAKQFFLKHMKLLWKAMCNREFYMYETIQKLVQLGEHEMDATALLVDEAQDLNQSQFIWCAMQAKKMQWVEK